MKNNSNIYDIDGVLIRDINDTHQMTIQEVKDKIEYYQNKIKESEDNTEIYNTYINNLQRYMLQLYSMLTPEQLQEQLNELKNNVTAEQIEKAMNELKEQVENDEQAGEDTTSEVSESITGGSTDTTNKESGDAEIIEQRVSDIYEESAKPQSSFLVERDDVNTVMDEYVPFAEENDEEK